MQPSVWHMLSQWRFDPFWIALVLICGWWYFRSVRRLEAMHPRVPHPRWKAWSFMGALVLIAIAAMSPIEHYGNTFLFVLFIDFIIISTIAPIFVVVASPLTLAFRVSGKRGRRRLRWLYRNRVAKILTYPMLTWLLFASVTYIWQFTRLTEYAVRNGAVRDIELLSLLLVGVLFYVPAFCADPVRWRMNYPLRVFYLFVEITHKALFGAMFTAMDHVFHPAMASRLPGWGPGALFDQRLGVLIVSAITNIVLLLVIASLIPAWVEYETRNSERIDKRLAKQREAEARQKAALEQVFRRPV